MRPAILIGLRLCHLAFVWWGMPIAFEFMRSRIPDLTYGVVIFTWLVVSVLYLWQLTTESERTKTVLGVVMLVVTVPFIVLPFMRYGLGVSW